MKSNAQSGNSQDRPKISSGAQPRTVMGRACFSQNNIHDEGIGAPPKIEHFLQDVDGCCR